MAPQPHRVPTHAPALLPAPSRRATIARIADSRSPLSSPCRVVTPQHAPRAKPTLPIPSPRWGCRTTTRPARQLTLAFPCPRRVIPPVRGHEPRRLLLACELAAPCQITIARSTTGQVPVPARRALAPRAPAGWRKLLSHAQTAALSLRGRRRRSPPASTFRAWTRVAARVVAARRDHRAQGPDEKRGPKRKAPHDEELLDRDHKRHRGDRGSAPPP
ncbi:hypothetical protein B0H14DRAFT_3866612 [Mycena olivaceomarginata]|nr:hypothetical protein B0H14DRAFT_3866612 [Mycena olivaceomarginata]